MPSKCICLLGFSKPVEERLRKLIAQHAKQSDIEWVSASNKQLDAVVINALFLKNPQIQKYIQAIACPCLTAYSGKQSALAVQDTELMALNIDIQSTTDETWYSILLGASHTKASSISHSARRPSPSGQHSPSARDTQKRPQVEEKSSCIDYDKLIKAIDDKSCQTILAEDDKSQTWIYPQEKSVYINYPREKISGIEKWKWQESNRSDMPNALRKMRLEQWLFETIWQSHNYKFKIDHKTRFQILRWPQPLSREGRTEALRIAAQIKYQPSSVTDLQEKTHYDESVIEKFLFAAFKAGGIKKIESAQEENAILERRRNIPEDPDRQLKRSFLGRLRKKLGL